MLTFVWNEFQLGTFLAAKSFQIKTPQKNEREKIRFLSNVPSLDGGRCRVIFLIVNRKPKKKEKEKETDEEPAKVLFFCCQIAKPES